MQSARALPFQVGLAQAGAHGLSGGLQEWAQGGNFTSGLYSGVVSSRIGSLTSGLGAFQVVAGIGGGGLASVAGGGDFLDGVKYSAIAIGLNHLEHNLTNIQPPESKVLSGFPEAEYLGRSKGQGRRHVWKLPNGKYLEWTSKNGVVEMYSKSGKKWLGKYNPTTGKFISTTSKLSRMASFVSKGISRVIGWMDFVCEPCMRMKLHDPLTTGINPKS